MQAEAASDSALPAYVSDSARAGRIGWQEWVALAVMLLGVVGAIVLRPTVHMSEEHGKTDLETIVPTELGNWRLLRSGGAVVLPTPELQQMLDSTYNQVLTRTYVNELGYRIMLSLAYGGDQSDGLKAHRPEVCYQAQGFQIKALQQTTLALAGREVPAVLVSTQMSQRHEPVTYWMTMGNKVVNSGTKQKIAQISYGLRGQIPEGMLVRVSSIDPDEARAYAMQRDFLQSLGRGIGPKDLPRIFGAETPATAQ